MVLVWGFWVAGFGEDELYEGGGVGSRFDEEVAAEELGDAAGDDEAEAGALLFVEAAFELHVGTDAGDLFGGHAASFIFDAEDELTAGDFGGDGDGVAGAGELEGIFDEFAGGFDEPVFFDAGGDIFELEDEVLFAGGGFGFFAGDLFEGVAGGAGGGLAELGDLLGAGADEFETGVDDEVFDEPVKAHAGLLDTEGELADFFCGGGIVFVGEDAGQAENAVERGEELVGEGGADVTAEFFQLAFGHALEGGFFVEAGGDGGEEFLHRVGLGEVVIGTEAHGVALVLATGDAGEEDEGDGGGLGVLLESGEGLVAVHVRHLDVTDDEVGRVFAGEFEAFASVSGAESLIAAGLEQFCGERLHRRIVVNNKNLLHSRWGWEGSGPLAGLVVTGGGGGSSQAIGGMRRSDVVVVGFIAALFHEVLEVDGVGGLVEGGLKFGPGGLEFCGAFGVGLRRGFEDFAVDGTQDIAHGDFSGWAGEEIAAVFTAEAADDLVGFEFEEDLDEVVGGNGLLLGEFFDAADASGAVVAGEFEDGADGVIAFYGEFHWG